MSVAGFGRCSKFGECRELSPTAFKCATFCVLYFGRGPAPDHRRIDANRVGPARLVCRRGPSHQGAGGGLPLALQVSPGR